MKRITCAVAAVGLLVGACGSGDDEPAADEPAADEAPADEPAAEEPPADEPPADEPAAEEPPAEDPPANDDDDDNDGGTRIRSISDVPEECRQEMAKFLREIEPIVSQIDWDTATLNDFEEISGDFDRISDEFSTSSANSNCDDDLDFVADNEFELLIEFARDEAPGTVGFFEFFETFSTAVGLDDGNGGDAGSAGGDDELTTCEDGIAFIKDLMETYDSIDDVPAAEIIKISQFSSLFITCSPEQLDEVSEFIGG